MTCVSSLVVIHDLKNIDPRGNLTDVDQLNVQVVKPSSKRKCLFLQAVLLLTLTREAFFSRELLLLQRHITIQSGQNQEMQVLYFRWDIITILSSLSRFRDHHG